MRSLVAISAVWLALAATAMAETPWEAYLSLPSPANAKRVSRVSYSDSASSLSGGDLQILRNQIFAQDIEAFQLGYRLYRAADGGDAEDLGQALASSIRAHPKFFLEQVALIDSQCTGFSWILNVPGEEYVDRLQAQAYEISMRREALNSVNAKALLPVRERCVAQLKQL